MVWIKTEKKLLLSRKKQSDILPKVEDWMAEDRRSASLSDESPIRLFGASGKDAEPQHQSCVLPTVKPSWDHSRMGLLLISARE